MKKILYHIYALFFYVYSLANININQTTFIMTHDSSINGNIMKMNAEIKRHQPNHICKFITRDDLNSTNFIRKIYAKIKFIFITPYYLATSKTIFLDNVFLPMAYMKFKKDVNVIQLWHGCNTIKKFGQLSNKGQTKYLEKKANSRYTHVMVSSKKMINLHKEAFGVDKKIIYPLGLPRLDLFFNTQEITKEKNEFYVQYPFLKGKNIILYAPTFRDNRIDKFDYNMNLCEVVQELPDNYILINKFHPFVNENYGKIEGERMIDLSDYEDLSRLLLISDILISDYSSIVFEYNLLNKPIIFYAYDKMEYEKHIRGFYRDYDESIKEMGQIISDKKDLSKEILKKTFKNNYDISSYIDFQDSKSTQRIYEKIYK